MQEEDEAANQIQEARDRNIALFFSSHGFMPPERVAGAEAQLPDSADIEIRRPPGDAECRPPDNAESSATAAARPPVVTEGQQQCVVCLEEFETRELVLFPCGHRYCNGCVRDLFTRSMTDEALFPPGCCRQPVGLPAVQHIISTEMLERYERRRVEIETQDRLYCSNQRCSAFLPANLVRNDRVVCPTCRTVTCTMCKGPAHRGDCPADTALRQVLDMAGENQWRRCPGCGRMVDLMDGCNHITVRNSYAKKDGDETNMNKCVCRTQFCHACGVLWKRCLCELYPEDNRPDWLPGNQGYRRGNFNVHIPIIINRRRYPRQLYPQQIVFQRPRPEQFPLQQRWPPPVDPFNQYPRPQLGRIYGRSIQELIQRIRDLRTSPTAQATTLFRAMENDWIRNMRSILDRPPTNSLIEYQGRVREIIFNIDNIPPQRDNIYPIPRSIEVQNEIMELERALTRFLARDNRDMVNPAPQRPEVVNPEPHIDQDTSREVLEGLLQQIREYRSQSLSQDPLRRRAEEEWTAETRLIIDMQDRIISDFGYEAYIQLLVGHIDTMPTRR